MTPAKKLKIFHLVMNDSFRVSQNIFYSFLYEYFAFIKHENFSFFM